MKSPGSWTKGKSGNPKGRTPGALSKHRTQLLAGLPEVLAAIYRLGLDGDISALTWWAGRIIGAARPTSDPVSLRLEGTLAERGEIILRAVASGTITPESGADLQAMLAMQSRLIETDDLSARVAALEANSGHP